jgi:hypothetical protein
MGKDYAPKFCRVRRCTLRFGHDDNCRVPQRVAAPWHAKTPAAHGVTVYYRPRKSPRMRHGTDPNPRRSAVLRVVNSEQRRRAAERQS